MDETAFEGSMNQEFSTASDTIPGGPVEKVEGNIRRFILAGLGAAATAADIAQDSYDRFVDRGEQVEEEIKQRREDRRVQYANSRTRMSEYLRGAMDQFLNTLNMPSKADVDTINVKLNIVNRKLDDLQLDQVRRETATQPVEGPPPAAPPFTQEDLGT